MWVKSKTSRNLYEQVRTIHINDRDIFVNNAQGKHSCASMAKKKLRERGTVLLFAYTA